MKILFVCTGNSCRSPMAKGYLEKRLKELGKEGIEVSSAGIANINGSEATDNAKQIAGGEGIDLSRHRARTITETDAREADLIFVMERRQKFYLEAKFPDYANKIYLLKEFKKIGSFKMKEDSDIEDPIGKDAEFYKKVFEVIRESIEKVLKEIV